MTERRALDAPEGDEHGYLTDEWLDQLRAHEIKSPQEAARFLTEVFPAAIQCLSCAQLETKLDRDFADRPVKEIWFATGGWSGCEELIGIMLGKFWIKQLHVRWERGGAYWFEVPIELIAPPTKEE